MNKPEKPCSKAVKSCIDKFTELDNYVLQEGSLNLLFNELCPKNKNIEHILLKVSALNDFYSTNIYDTYSVANHILKCDIDAGLDSYDIQLVNQIAEITIKGKTRKFYSFASKYCSHHKPESFPIYDSYVEKMLMHFKRVDKFDKFVKLDLKTYSKFIDIIKNFQSYYSLNEFSLREIDIYLWLSGKEHFPNKY